MTLKLFIRQSFTEAGEQEAKIIQDILEILQNMDGRPHNLEFLTATKAYTRDTFKLAFEADSGRPFTPQNFRNARLASLKEADAMIVIRTGLSESTSFEIAYNIFNGNKAPIFFAIWQPKPIKTTLLRDLDDHIPVVYHTFKYSHEVIEPLAQFLNQVAWGVFPKQVAEGFYA